MRCLTAWFQTKKTLQHLLKNVIGAKVVTEVLQQKVAYCNSAVHFNSDTHSLQTGLLIFKFSQPQNKRIPCFDSQ